MGYNDANIKKIDGRDWKVVRDKWMSYVPEIEFPGKAPFVELKKFSGLQDIYTNTARFKNVPYYEEVPLLRSAILHEGLFLTHKAIHVCGTAILSVNHGVISWSLTNAYQSSFFAVKAILSLLGLSFPQLSKPLMIDCFPKGEELSRSAIKKGVTPKVELQFLIFNDLSHVEHWEILQRVLNVSTIECWDEDIISYLRSMTGEQFVDERNKLHYINNYWTFPPDMFVASLDETFAENDGFKNDFKSFILSSNKQHTFFINYALIKMALALVKELGELSTDIKTEYDLMLNTIKGGNHSRFLNSIDTLAL